MPKIKLSVKEMNRISIIIKNKIEEKKGLIKNLENQKFSSLMRKESVKHLQREDLLFLELIKEKFDIETFGKNG